MKLKIVRTSPQSKLPEKIKGDLCYDLFTIESGTLMPGERRLFDTGCIIGFPEGFGGNIRDRSGHAYKKGLHILGGVIDETFRDTTKILIINLGVSPVAISMGEKLAQLKLEKDYHCEVEEVDSLDDTTRGVNGFGSNYQESLKV
jgi:dUTP pyrophosphatase